MPRFSVKYIGPQHVEIEAKNQAEAEVLAEEEANEYWNWTATEMEGSDDGGY